MFTFNLESFKYLQDREVFGRKVVQNQVNFINEFSQVAGKENALMYFCLVTSGFRSPGYNEKVGGRKKSRHLVGLAFDFKVKLDMEQRFPGESGTVGPFWYYYFNNKNNIHVELRNDSN